MAEIDMLLDEMVVKGASDLHLYSNHCPNIRQNGLILKLGDECFDKEKVGSLIDEICPDCYKDDFLTQFETDFAYSVSGSNNRFRVNIFNDQHGVCAVFRHIPEKLPSFESILLEDSAKRLCELTKGLVLVTGATGSGKSTTLAAMMNHINQTRKYHIVTVEDPIEFVYKSEKSLVHQRELELHTKSYHHALRAVLRQDPDVILVGEMRDTDTTRLAVEAAETGHLVFATLHTNSAYSTISRIINQFPSDEQELIRVMLSDNLKGVICQNLLMREDLPEGGRIAAREIWLYTVAGANLIRENKLHQIQSLLEGNQDIGMTSMNASLVNLVSEDKVSAENAWQASVDQKDLASRFSRIGIQIEE